jgi:hypothetical protein
MYGQQVMCWAAKLGTQDGTFFGFIGGSVDQIDIARMDCLMKFISDCQSPFYIEVVYFRSWRCPKFRPFSDFPSVNFSWTEIRRFPALKVVLIGAVIALIIWIGLDAPTTFPLVPHWFPLGTWWLATKKGNGSNGSQIRFWSLKSFCFGVLTY